MFPFPVHSHHTHLGATVGIDDLVAQAARDGLPALALADRNALYGAVAFERACRAAGIRPIHGLTLRVRPPDGGDAAELVLLAQTATGYQNLCRLSSWLQGHPDRADRCQQGVAWETLAAHSVGLLAIDGGRRGHVARCLRTAAAAARRAFAHALAQTFGDRACLGLEVQHTPTLTDLPDAVMTLAQQCGLPTVALQPVYCLHNSERPTLRLLAAIARNCRLDAVPPDALPDGGDDRIVLHWQTPAELAQRYAAYPEASARTTELAGRCAERVLPDGRPIWPNLAAYIKAGQSADAALQQAAAAGLAQRYADGRGTERLQNELGEIARHGFAPFFLVVADIVRYARRRAIPVSTRGSVANSLVAYCLGITTVDPLAHDLLFERFLNPARSSLPDIDLDFCSRRRDEILAYVRRRYGVEHVALVATVNTFKHKSAVREAAKAHGADEAQMAHLSTLLARGPRPDPQRRDTRTLADVIAEVDNAADRAVLRAAAPLIGLPHHLGVHPGGLVITPTPLTDSVPLQWSPKGFIITQYDHSDLEAIGLPKLDLLGIRALTVLADAADWIRAHADPTFDVENIPADDAPTGDLLARGETVGVFQCESHGAQRTLRRLKARSLHDLAVANAFFKPGPATGGMADAFVRRYRGEETVRYLHPSLERILAPTQGVLLFQEQVLRVATEVAGLDWNQANAIRKGMSKFDAAGMRALQAQFVASCRRPGIGMSAAQAETLWQQVLSFAGYGFNQGHATAYAAVSYHSAWLKTHYPAAFLLGRLVNGGGFYHPAVYIAEARRLRLSVRPPHINHSARRFTLETTDGTPTLWMGLGWVRDLHRSAAAQIVGERPFRNLADLLRRVSLQKREVQHLIQCGALDGLGASRSALLAEAERTQAQPGQLSMDFGDRPPVDPETAVQRLAWERHVLGFPVSVHPLATVAAVPDALPIRRLDAHPATTVTIAGARLPGWDAAGFLFDDGDSFVRAVRPLSQKDKPKPPTWQPVALRGQWRHDRFGNAAFVVEEWRPLR